MVTLPSVDVVIARERNDSFTISVGTASQPISPIHRAIKEGDSAFIFPPFVYCCHSGAAIATYHSDCACGL